MNRHENGQYAPGGKEKTDTHRRCSVCREWRTLDYYRPRAAQCRDCVNRKRRDRYAKLNDEQISEVYAKIQSHHRAQRKRKAEQMLEDAQRALTIMRNKGLTPTMVFRITGLTFNTQKEIMAGQRKYMHKRTVDALYEALGRIK